MSARKILPIIILAGVVMLTQGAIPASTAHTRAGSLSPNLAPTTSMSVAVHHLGPEVRISTPSSPLDVDRHEPAVAYNWRHDQYLVAWQNQWSGNRDIYAQRVSTSGELVGPWFAISAGTGDRVQPAIAYSATDDEYLVVWMKEVSADVYEIWGRIVAWNGGYMHPEFKIISWTNRSFWTPRVAWNSFRNEYMVVWNAFNTTASFPPGIPNDIAGARVTNQDGGKVIDTDILIPSSEGGPHQVDITYNLAMNEYLIVFVIIHTEATSGNDIYGRRIGWDGTPGNWLEIYVDNYTGGRRHQNHPAVATNEQDKYMVVWEHQYSLTDHDIYAREYNADGTPDGSYFTIASWTEDDRVPDVAANGSSKEWLAVWQRELPGGSGYAIHGFRWGSAGSGVRTYLFDVANWTFIEATDPAVAADIPGYLIVYEEINPPAKQHIYGRMWWPEAVYMPLVLRG